MQLRRGTRLGPYEIVEPLGAGGMGEVYLARDTRLSRNVAIKILPADLEGDARFRLRFEREARAISALNHPHICTLHDVRSENGLEYLVMEYCEGRTLADRLARGPMPVEQVLEIGAQIADALGRAHRTGIIHRDLKPSNVMLTQTGAKVLDFGLAKQTRVDAAGTDTASLDASGGETLAGTLGYIAPEVLAGGEADRRSDIFALGAVLFEMATGARAFRGDSHAALASSILTSTPPPIAAAPALDR
ncbi:MAG TPA: serine/threonine-protein kinase, partial [Thermoanaerobaculia bacterium]|nr:serine/threonine-protein kinase [Thermoanaerobaculia bacterium]